MKSLRALALAVLVAGAFPAVALAESLAQEEAEGAQIFRQLRQRERSCSDLSQADFERAGEYVMGRMMGGAHASMNRMLEARLGRRGEEQVHVAMGKRWTGCDPNARYPAGVGGMMGGAMMGPGGGGGGPGSGGMMGSGTQGNGGAGGFDHQPGSDGGWPRAATVTAIVLGLLLLVAVAAVVALVRRGQGEAPGPLAILHERLARGEISEEEFRQQRQLLTS